MTKIGAHQMQLEKVPVVEKPVIYLDQNIYVRASKDASFYELLKALVSTDRYVFPFTHVHIAEVNRITGVDRNKETQTLLTTIEEISNSQYLDYRDEIKACTIRKRDPFEVFETMNQVPKGFLDGVSKLAIEEYPIAPIEGSLPNGHTLVNQYRHLTEIFRKQFPELGKKLNNLTKQEATKAIEADVFKGLTFEQAFEILALNQTQARGGLPSFTLEFFVENTLYMAGYKTPNSDLEKTEGLLSDHLHLGFAKNCPIVISDDTNFRKKILAVCEPGSKFVADSDRGINFLIIHSGLANLVSSETGESLNQQYIEHVLNEAKKGGNGSNNAGR